MKDDFIETVVGFIPKYWSILKLEDISRFITKGGTPTTYGFDWADEENGIPFFRSECVTDDGFNPKGMNFISVDAHRQMNRSEVKPGDLLMTITGNIGRVARAPTHFQSANINQHIARIRIQEGSKVSADYVYQCLKHDGYVTHYRAILTGQAYPQISLQQVRETPIPLPPFPEQQKIAAILAAVDDKLDVITRQIEATQTLKQGLMQTLFSCGAGTQDAAGRWVPHSKFKDSELGIIPACWDIGLISDYASTLRSGVSVNAEDRIHGDNEVGVLKVSSVARGEFHPSLHKTVIPEERHRVAEPVLQGRIIVSRANTPALVGESAYVDTAWPDLFLPDKLWQIVPSERSHSVRWLAFYLQSSFVRQEIIKEATGTSGSMKNISKSAFLGIRMPLVPLIEQEHIAVVLAAVTSKIETLSHKHERFQALKCGLMQKLLNGEWRVKSDTPGETT